MWPRAFGFITSMSTFTISSMCFEENTWYYKLSAFRSVRKPRRKATSTKYPFPLISSVAHRSYFTATFLVSTLFMQQVRSIGLNSFFIAVHRSSSRVGSTGYSTLSINLFSDMTTQILANYASSLFLVVSLHLTSVCTDIFLFLSDFNCFELGLDTVLPVEEKSSDRFVYDIVRAGYPFGLITTFPHIHAPQLKLEWSQPRYSRRLGNGCKNCWKLRRETASCQTDLS